MTISEAIAEASKRVVLIDADPNIPILKEAKAEYEKLKCGLLSDPDPMQLEDKCGSAT